MLIKKVHVLTIPANKNKKIHNRRIKLTRERETHTHRETERERDTDLFTYMK